MLTMNRSGEEGEEQSDGRTTFSKIRGTKVYDADGEKFGHVSDVEMNRSTLNPTHLIVHKGFFGEYLRVNLKYVEKITPDEIRLWISPAKNLVGMRVLDAESNEVGVVKEAEKDRDGDLEYVRADVRVLMTKEEGEKLNKYMVPTMPMDDMSISFQATPLEEGPMSPQIELFTEEIYIDAEDIVNVGKDCIKISMTKDELLE